MGFKLKKSQSFKQNVKRIARCQLSRVIEAFNGPVDDEAIHSVRKRLKNIRALLRFARPQLGKQYKPLNIAYRDIGRKLSGIRDSQSMIESANRLKTDDLATRQAVAQDVLLERLHQHHNQKVEQFKPMQTDQFRLDMLEQFETLRKEIANWRITKHAKGHWAGMKKTYKRGCKALKHVKHAVTDEALHDLRKRAKYHCAHLKLVAPLKGDRVKNQKKNAKALCDLLGDDHDLVLLQEFIQSDRTISPEMTGELDQLFAEQRALLQSYAIELAERVYTHKSKHLTPKRRVLTWK